MQGWDRETEEELIYKPARKMESQLVEGVEKAFILRMGCHWEGTY